MIRRQSSTTILIFTASLAVFGSLALAAQDRYTLQIPDGLAWSEFRGYETWENVAVSQTETVIKVIVANPVMTEAFRSGLPADGKLFPDGSKVAKIEWTFKKNTVAPYFVNVPDTLKNVGFIEKDTKRSRTRTDGHMPSGLMMQRPTRLSLPNLIQGAPTVGSRATRQWRQRITFSQRIQKGELDEPHAGDAAPQRQPMTRKLDLVRASSGPWPSLRAMKLASLCVRLRGPKTLCFIYSKL
jgi:hypothetical protein